MTTPSPENAVYEYTLNVATLAYIYGYAPMTQYVLMAQDIIDRAPMNAMYYSSSPASASSQIFSGANADCLYATAWLDLTNTPIILETPDTRNQEMWHTIQLLDMYTNTVKNLPGIDKKKKPKYYLIIGPNNNIEDFANHPNVSYGVKIIQVPTNIIYLVARVAVLYYDVDTSLQVLHSIKIQQMYRDADVLNIDPFTPDIFTTPSFFTALVNLMNYNAPPAGEGTLINLFKSIGIDPASTFDPESLSTEAQTALADAIDIALPEIIPFGYLYGTGIVTTNRWTGGTKLGIYDFDYLRRDFMAFGGSAGNVPIEQNYFTCIQDSTGALLNGANHKYKMHFDSDRSQYPIMFPTGFWSITLYVNTGQLVYGFNLQLYDNEINKYSVGTNNNNLITNGDWSLDLFIQHEAPTDPLELANWLPCPAGPFRLIFRVYSGTVDQIYFPNIPAIVINDA